MHTKMIICEWENYEQELAELFERIDAGEKATTPFPLLALTDLCEIQKRATELYTGDKYPSSSLLGAIQKSARKGVITVGYFLVIFGHMRLPF